MQNLDSQALLAGRVLGPVITVESSSNPNPSFSNSTPPPSEQHLEDCLRKHPQQWFPNFQSPEKDLNYLEALLRESYNRDGHFPNSEELDSISLDHISFTVNLVGKIFNRRLQEWVELMKRHWHMEATNRQWGRGTTYCAGSPRSPPLEILAFLEPTLDQLDPMKKKNKKRKKRSVSSSTEDPPKARDCGLLSSTSPLVAQFALQKPTYPSLGSNMTDNATSDTFSTDQYQRVERAQKLDQLCPLLSVKSPEAMKAINVECWSHFQTVCKVKAHLFSHWRDIVNRCPGCGFSPSKSGNLMRHIETQKDCLLKIIDLSQNQHLQDLQIYQDDSVPLPELQDYHRQAIRDVVKACRGGTAIQNECVEELEEMVRPKIQNDHDRAQCWDKIMGIVRKLYGEPTTSDVDASTGESVMQPMIGAPPPQYASSPPHSRGVFHRQQAFLPQRVHPPQQIPHPQHVLLPQQAPPPQQTSFLQQAPGPQDVFLLQQGPLEHPAFPLQQRSPPEQAFRPQPYSGFQTSNSEHSSIQGPHIYARNPPSSDQMSMSWGSSWVYDKPH